MMSSRQRQIHCTKMQSQRAHVIGSVSEGRCRRADLRPVELRVDQRVQRAAVLRLEHAVLDLTIDLPEVALARQSSVQGRAQTTQMADCEFSAYTHDIKFDRRTTIQQRKTRALQAV